MFKFFRRKCQCNDIGGITDEMLTIKLELKWLRDAVQGLQENEPVTTGATKRKPSKKKK